MVVAGPRAPRSRKVGFLQFSKWHVSDCAFYVSLSIAYSCQVLSNLVDSCESGAADNGGFGRLALSATNKKENNEDKGN